MRPFVIVDNSKDGEERVYTPRLIEWFGSRGLPVVHVRTRAEAAAAVGGGVAPLGVVLGGGPLCLSEKIPLEHISKDTAMLLHFRDVPVLGICLGFQIIAAAYGGRVRRLGTSCFGTRPVEVVRGGGVLLEGEGPVVSVVHGHCDVVVEPPPGFEVTARSSHCVHAVESRDLLRFGVQFHPEADGDAAGTIGRFVAFCRSHAAY